jgi:hypothetical protein
METVAESAGIQLRPSTTTLGRISDRAVMSILANVSDDEPGGRRRPETSKNSNSNPVKRGLLLYARYGPLKGWIAPHTDAPNALHRRYPRYQPSDER